MFKNTSSSFKYKGTLRASLLLMSGLIVGLGSLLTNPVSAASTTYTLTSLNATVTNTSVKATAVIKASRSTTASLAGVCVRNSAGADVDFPALNNVTINTTNTTLSPVAASFSPGTYTYFACIQVSGIWYNVGSSKTFTVVSPPPVGGSVALSQWRSALSNRVTAPVSWIAYGDSITEGQGASSRQNRWIDTTLKSLRTSYPTPNVAGGAGYLPGWNAVWASDSPWKPYSGRTGTIGDWEFGSLGLRTAALSAGATQTYTVTGTSAQIYYTTGGGTFSYAVDGGTPTTVNSAGTYKTDNSVRAVFSLAGTHTVKITALTGTSYLEGIMAFNDDENKGIRLYDNAHSGYTTTSFINAQGDINPILKSISPDLVTIALGVNDYGKATVSPSTVKANLKAMIADIRAQLPAKQPSIVIVLTYNIAAQSGTLAPWADYAAAIRSVSSEDTSVGLLDMSSMGTANPGGYWSSDGLHPSDSGYAEMARRASLYLSGN